MFWSKVLEFIKSFEGFSPVKYKCSGGVDTFGYGSLVKNYPNVEFPVTKEQASEYLLNHVHKDYKFLYKSTYQKLNDNQKIALLDFIYNLGRGAYQGSTLRMKINRGEFEDAAHEFIKWNKARVRGVLKPINGLTRRRIAERELFVEKMLGNIIGDVIF